jgi:hypothetical protein
MKLSEQIYNDFLKDWSEKDDYRKHVTYKMSYDYLTNLIEQIKELEDAIPRADYDLLTDELRESRIDTDIYKKALRNIALEFWVLLFKELKQETPNADEIVYKFYQEAKTELEPKYSPASQEITDLLANDSLGG